MAGSGLCRVTPRRDGGAGSAFLRFTVVQPVWRRDTVAGGFAQHHALPRLLDGAVGCCDCSIYRVFLHLPRSPPALTAAGAASDFSLILPVARTSSSYFLALSVLFFLAIPEN